MRIRTLQNAVECSHKVNIWLVHHSTSATQRSPHSQRGKKRVFEILSDDEDEDVISVHGKSGPSTSKTRNDSVLIVKSPNRKSSAQSKNVAQEQRQFERERAAFAERLRAFETQRVELEADQLELEQAKLRHRKTVETDRRNLESEKNEQAFQEIALEDRERALAERERQCLEWESNQMNDGGRIIDGQANAPQAEVANAVFAARQKIKSDLEAALECGACFETMREAVSCV